MSGYKDPRAVFLAGSSQVKVDPNDLSFDAAPPELKNKSLPIIYLFSNSGNGDGAAYAMAEDGTVLGSHICSHWGYMQHDLHDRPDRMKACQSHYPNGYQLIVLMNPGELPPKEVLERGN